jgi:hypothetical protein
MIDLDKVRTPDENASVTTALARDDSMPPSESQTDTEQQQLPTSSRNHGSCLVPCPCCKQRHCQQPPGHRDTFMADKRYWHRCSSDVCPVW